MDFSDFIAERAREQAWRRANGFDNGDPETNGEFAFARAALREADVYVDVGANEGEFLKLARTAKNNLTLFAFEPNPAHREKLEAILEGRKGGLHEVALADAPGRATLHVHEVHHVAASLTDRPRMTETFRKGLRKVDVEIATLDAYADKIRAAGTSLFLKIDAEGFEAPVLRGGGGVLKTAAGFAIMFEYSFAWQETGESLLACYQALNAMGAEFYRITPYGLEHMRIFTNDMETPQYCNYVAMRDWPGLDQFERVEIPTTYGVTSLLRFPD